VWHLVSTTIPGGGSSDFNPTMVETAPQSNFRAVKIKQFGFLAKWQEDENHFRHL
jgi:hypothetical protein